VVLRCACSACMVAQVELCAMVQCSRLLVETRAEPGSGEQEMPVMAALQAGEVASDGSG
jgi:hypothetical protein